MATHTETYEALLRSVLDARKRLNHYLYLDRRAATKKEQLALWRSESTLRSKAKDNLKKAYLKLANYLANRAPNVRAQHRVLGKKYTTTPHP